MTFTGDESSQITLAQATSWTANYKRANPSATKAHFFGMNKLNSILCQTGCVGIRAYYAIDDNGAIQLVLIGVDANCCDLTTGVIIERSMPCPPYCDINSPLGK